MQRCLAERAQQKLMRSCHEARSKGTETPSRAFGVGLLVSTESDCQGFRSEHHRSGVLYARQTSTDATGSHDRQLRRGHHHPRIALVIRIESCTLASEARIPVVCGEHVTVFGAVRISEWASKWRQAMHHLQCEFVGDLQGWFRASHHHLPQDIPSYPILCI